MLVATNMVFSTPEPSLLAAAWMPPRPMRRKNAVPTNSRLAALTSWPKLANGELFSELFSVVVVLLVTSISTYVERNRLCWGDLVLFVRRWLTVTHDPHTYKCKSRGHNISYFASVYSSLALLALRICYYSPYFLPMTQNTPLHDRMLNLIACAT